MENTKECLTIKNEDGVDVEICVVSPTHKMIQDANLIYNMKVASCIRDGQVSGERLLLRAEVEDYLVKTNVWSNADKLRMEELGINIRARELMLRKGGLKISEGRQIAIEMNELRNQMLQLYTKRQQLDSATIESAAENHRFNFLASKCILNKLTEKPCYKDFNDYLNKSHEIVAIEGSKKLAKMLYGLEESIKSSLFEIKWLRNAGFINEEGKYTDRSGKLTDKDGRHIDENGRYINEEGNLIDRSGNLVDPKGDFMVESKPFVDDETGVPVEFKVGD
jgi:hypothetical protein